METILIILIIVLVLIVVLLLTILYKAYRLFNNMQATIIMQKALIDRDDANENNQKSEELWKHTS